MEGLAFAWEPVTDAPLNDWFNKEEKATHADFKTVKRAAEWRAGRIAVKRLVAAETGAAYDDIMLRPDEAGAPHLYVRDRASSVRVSITHRDGIAIAAFGMDAVGIDLETIEPHADAFWEQAFSEEERNQLRSMDNADMAAACAWAAKEACLKRNGTGLDCPLHEVRVEPKGGAATVTGPFGAWGVQFYDLEGRVLAVTTPTMDATVTH